MLELLRRHEYILLFSVRVTGWYVRRGLRDTSIVPQRRLFQEMQGVLFNGVRLDLVVVNMRPVLRQGEGLAGVMAQAARE